MRIKAIIITLSVVLFVVVGGLIAFFLTGESVKTAEDAAIIAQEYISRRYGDKYSECVIGSVCLEEDTWVVAFRDKKTIYIAGGGYPTVFINENNDRLIWCLLQK